MKLIAEKNIYAFCSVGDQVDELDLVPFMSDFVLRNSDGKRVLVTSLDGFKPAIAGEELPKLPPNLDIETPLGEAIDGDGDEVDID